MQRNFNKGELQAALNFIHENLEPLKLSREDLLRADLVCEESLLRLMKYSDFDVTKYFRVRVRKSFGNIFVDLSVPGLEFDFAESLEIPDDNEISPESQEAVQNLIFRSFKESISFKRSRQFNTITVRAFTSNYSSLYKVLTALILAILTGLSIRAFLPEDLSMMFNDNVFALITEIFLDGLKLCAVPVVFFSIIVCFADIGNLRGVKKAGIKLFIWFTALQAAAVLLGFCFVFLSGTGKGAGLSLPKVRVIQDISSPLKDTIEDLVPDNTVKLFLEANMLQLIVLAAFAGSAAGALGAKSILRICNEFSAIFMQITAGLSELPPLIESGVS